MQPSEILQALASMELDERVQVLGAAFAQTLTAYKQLTLHFGVRTPDHDWLLVSASVDPDICERLRAVHAEQREGITRTRGDGPTAARVIGQLLAKGGRL